MTVHNFPAAFGLDAYVSAQSRKSLLRFIACGSVDDGKSTLIGRLLYETKQVFDDQIAALERDSRKHGTQGGALDYALLVDGLSAEREQGITIDVAYRFFSTPKRAFIVADTPGHEQYTRNMATGASTADLAVLLVDARQGLTRQTRRHSLLVSMLGIRHVVLAVNKMDLVGWSEATFDGIMAEHASFAADLGFDEVVGIPISALTGDNLRDLSPNTPWYRGPALLRHLEEVEVETASGASEPFRMSVQWVNRPDASFRGYAGLIGSGSVRVGMPVRVYPSGRETTVSRIVTFDGDLDCAIAGQAVTLTLADNIDLSRGDVIGAHAAPPRTGQQLQARLFWMADSELRPGASFLVKLGAASARATVAAVQHRIDPDSAEAAAARVLRPNDIGDVALVLDRPLAFDSYRDNRETGSLILIDPEGFDTVAMGLVLGGEAAGAPAAIEAADVAPGSVRRKVAALLPRTLASPSEQPWRSIAKAVSWRVTGSLDTTLLAYLFTGNLRLSAAIGLAEVMTKLVLYYGHERIWARIRLGVTPARPDA